MSPEHGTKKNFALPLLFAIVMVMGIQIGYKMYDHLKMRGGFASLDVESASTLEEVMRYIDARYVDTINRQELVREVIDGTLEKLDPHSSFIPADKLDSVNEQLEGNFEGIGIEFILFRDTLQVIAAISGGPSEKKGIQSGDKILTVNDTLIAGVGISSEEVISRLRGPKGTVVNLGILKEPGQIQNIIITRDEIPLHSVDICYKVNDNTGYIKISRFSATTVDEFRKGLIKLKEMGINNLIIDLRDNPGGFLDAATEIADELLDKKRVLVYTQGKNFPRKEYYSRRPGLFEEGKVAVLINQGSASASEILAGAVQDWDRGHIIGRRSFGKGLVQEQYDLQDGSALRLTVARYFTPTGRCIQKPYNGQKKEKYDEDIYDRIEHGEYYTADSIKVNEDECFVTPSGKEVFGGGGISPDIFVPIDSTLDNSYIEIKNLVPEFLTDYFSSHRSKLFIAHPDYEKFAANYSGEEEYRAFRKFAEKTHPEISSHQLDLLKKETYELIKALLARLLWNDEGYFPLANKNDPFILAALKVFREK